MSSTHFRVNPHSIFAWMSKTPCSKQAWYLKFRWLERDMFVYKLRGCGFESRCRDYWSCCLSYGFGILHRTTLTWFVFGYICVALLKASLYNLKLPKDFIFARNVFVLLLGSRTTPATIHGWKDLSFNGGYSYWPLLKIAFSVPSK